MLNAKLKREAFARGGLLARRYSAQTETLVDLVVDNWGQPRSVLKQRFYAEYGSGILMMLFLNVMLPIIIQIVAKWITDR